MANAAAKKAAIARKQAKSFYQPFIIIINLIHIALTCFHSTNGSIFDTSNVIWMCVQWGLTLFAFIGILDDAESNTGSNSSSKKLAGGIYLDLLGLVVFTQFVGLYVSPIMRWLLVAVLVGYGAMKLWGILGFGGGGNDGSGTDAGGKSEEDSADSKELEERRRKRSERRRQKRA